MSIFLIAYLGKLHGKKGFYQREIREALKVLEEYPDAGIFLVPVRLDDCQPHFEQLKALQYVDLFPEWNVGINKILRLLQVHRQSESVVSNITNIRFRSHQARFVANPAMFYFITITNLQNHPITLAHVWYEDAVHHIHVQPESRLLPKRLDISEI